MRVTIIENCAFEDCESLTSITIPSSVVTIIGNPFCFWHGNLYNESKKLYVKTMFYSIKIKLLFWYTEQKKQTIQFPIVSQRLEIRLFRSATLSPA